jgi:hypothetical protein
VRDWGDDPDPIRSSAVEEAHRELCRILWGPYGNGPEGMDFRSSLSWKLKVSYPNDWHLTQAQVRRQGLEQLNLEEQQALERQAKAEAEAQRQRLEQQLAGPGAAGTGRKGRLPAAAKGAPNPGAAAGGHR